MPSKENRNKVAFLQKVIEEYTSKITGREQTRVVDIHGKGPEDIFYVGKLSPMGAEEDIRSSKTNIHQIGVDFIVDKFAIEQAELKISPKGEFFYRVFPTLAEQKKAAEEASLLSGKKSNKFLDLQEADSEEEVEETAQKKRADKIEILPVYEKFSLENKNYEHVIKLSEIFEAAKGFGYKEIHDGLNRIIDEECCRIIMKPDTYRVVREKITVKALESEEAWSDFLQNRSEAKSVLPKWDLIIEVEIKELRNELYRISVFLTNKTPNDSFGKKAGKTHINTLFNSGLSIELVWADFQPINLEYFEDDYKYDKTQRGIGHNCSISWDLLKPRVLTTTHLPLFTQYRLKTREDLVVRFNELITQPSQVLRGVYEEMIIELEKWKRDFEARKTSLGADPESNLKACHQFEEEIKSFEFEIDRFLMGIKMVEEHDYVKKAFILMNKAFAKSAKNYDSWRLFQIVFIVSLIPDVTVCEYGEDLIGKSFIDEVDLLYFPTGGGKTEAFLGTIIFTLFFDRLRGKNGGNTALIKYPLRLLSVQQVGRMADILVSAELERRNSVDIKDSEEFSLGYYVGDVNTPNALSKEVLEAMLNKTQEQLDEEYRIVDRCPFCQQKSIQIQLDQEHLRLQHVCTTPDCPSHGTLPIYIVDKEIYRYIPSVIVSTIDKLAAIGYQSDFRNILGEVSHTCPKHGYTSKTRCTEKECKVDIGEFEQVELYDPAPTLLIQDELHLIRESLGAFDGHYETLFQYMIRHLSKSKKKLKIIGATATISSYGSQLYHLYFKNGIRFPSQSPYLDHNFYADVDKEEENRFILGYAPYGKAIINSVVYSMKYLKQIIWDYYKNPLRMLEIPGIELANEQEALDILKDYWIFLQYNNVKLDGNKVLSALEDPINTELELEGVSPFDERKMTGDDTFQDVRKILAEVETTKNVFEGFNLITATSMISHGVDADKFNIMFFFGMPGNTAEYIQAYSRTGRKFPALVIMIMRPSREKDQSYLKNFVKFHEFKDILVEPVPINRWATKAVEKTLPGIFAGIIINYYDRQLQFEHGNIYNMKNLKKAIQEGWINREEVTQHILKAYGCIQENDVQHNLGNQYKIYIIEQMNSVFEGILTRSYDVKDYYLLEGIEKLGLYSPMTSLRDTDKPVKVKLE